ncbi:MAG: diaminobutyrate--2-oxoglutarate transaminase, partial [Rhodobacter sp.]|nr:diaminobutyrate--2-oxoglutarate transaminase [Rhodobacter sp.]
MRPDGISATSSSSRVEIFERMESRVRSYSRSWPTVFVRAQGAHVWDDNGRAYIDFFAGAGSLNYGHNPPSMKKLLIEYLAEDGVVQSLDAFTAARAQFLEALREVILRPRALDYRVQFPGPAGTTAVEAALKLARIATGRTNVVCFTNSFHGMSLGALAASGNRYKRAASGAPLGNCTFLPFDGFLGPETDSASILRRMLLEPGSGIDPPAAILLETVQGEGGVRVASDGFLQAVATVAKEAGALLIIDDIQVGCGRTGEFFSFESAGLRPDLVCLSKSVSGYGLPMALLLIGPSLDVWEPGAHSGTFRASNPAIVTATEALNYWRDDTLSR